MPTRLEDRSAGLRRKGGRVVSDKRSRAAKPDKPAKKSKPSRIGPAKDPFGTIGRQSPAKLTPSARRRERRRITADERIQPNWRLTPPKVARILRDTPTDSKGRLVVKTKGDLKSLRAWAGDLKKQQKQDEGTARRAARTERMYAARKRAVSDPKNLLQVAAPALGGTWTGRKGKLPYDPFAKHRITDAPGQAGTALIPRRIESEARRAMSPKERAAADRENRDNTLKALGFLATTPIGPAGKLIGPVGKAIQLGLATRSAVKAGGGVARLAKAAQGIRISRAALRAAPKAAVIGSGKATSLAARAAVLPEVAPGGSVQKALEGQGRLAAITPAALGGKGAAGVPLRALRDLLSLPANALPMVYLPLAAALHYKQTGDDTKLKALWDDFLKTSPTARLAQGDFKGFVNALSEHPLYGALEVAGGYAIVGRSAGGVARTLGLPGSKAGLGSRKGIPLQSGQEFPRELSPNLLTSMAQRVIDAGRPPKVGGRKSKWAERQIIASEFGAERTQRQQELSALNSVAKKLDLGKITPALRDVIQGQVTPGDYAANIAREVARLKTAAKKLDGHELARNVKRREALAASKSPKAIKKLTRGRDEYAKIMDALETRSIEAGFGTPEQYERAAAKPALLTHFPDDVKFNQDPEIGPRGLIERTPTKDEGPRPQAAIDQERAKANAAEPPPERVAQAIGELKEVAPEWRYLTTPRIRERLAEAGLDRGPAYLSEAPRRTTTLNEPQGVDTTAANTHLRTGKTTLDGTGPSELRDILRTPRQRIRALTRFETLSRILPSIAPEARYGTKHEAINSLPEDYTPINFDVYEKRGLIERAMRDGNPDAFDPESIAYLERDDDTVFAEAQEDRPGTWGGISPANAKYIQGQVKPAALNETMAALQSGWKKVILSTSPSWYAGNYFNSALIALANRTFPAPFGALGAKYGVGMGGRGRMIGEHMGPRFQAATVPGGVSATDLGTGKYNRPTPEELKTYDRFFRAGATVARSRGVGTVHRWLDLGMEASMKMNQRIIESPLFEQMVGRVATREVRRSMGGVERTMPLQKQAIKDFMDGLNTTPAQVAFARQVFKETGNWSYMSPGERQAKANFMPFYLWYRAASRFVFVTMPHNHPILTGGLAALASATDEERRNLGLHLFGEDRQPSYLQGGLPADGGIKRTATLTAFGIFSDYPGNLASAQLSPYGSLLNAAKGLRFTGDKYRKDNGDELDDLERAGLAGLLFVESFIPLLGLANRANAQGRQVLAPGWYRGKKNRGRGRALREAAIPGPLPGSRTYDPAGDSGGRQSRSSQPPGLSSSGGGGSKPPGM